MQWREQKAHKYLHFKILYGGQKLHKYFNFLLTKDMFLLNSLYIRELRNDRKLKCENVTFIVLILILRKVVF